MTEAKSKKTTVNEYIANHKGIVLIFLLITMTLTFVAPLKSFILQWLIDASSKENALKYLLLGSVITILSFILELLSRNLATKIKCESINSIRQKIVERVLRKKMDKYLMGENADIVSILTNDMRIIYDDYYTALYNIILYAGMMFFALCMYIYINPSLLIFVALASIAPLVLPRFLDKRLKITREQYSTEIGKYTSYIGDIFKGFEIIKQFNVISNFNNIHIKRAANVSDQEDTLQKNINLSITMSSFLGDILFFIILLLGMFLYFDGKITIGYMVAAANLSNYVMSPCKIISQQYASLKSTKGIRKKVDDIVKEAMECKEKEEIEEIEEIDEISQVVWKNVGFSYHNTDEPVLNNVNMTWEKEDKIALLGKSGSGKTTLIKIFCKYYNNYQGKVLVDSKDLKKINIDSFYKKIGIVSQNTYLFNDTIRNNICLYDSYSEDEIEYALIKAGIIDYINTLPDGLDTHIIENGKNLSGGQAQRLALARAIIRKKEILIIDEGTTGLDMETAQDIMDNILGFKGMLIMITHDIHGKYMKHFNKKYYINNGEMNLIT